VENGRQSRLAIQTLLLGPGERMGIDRWAAYEVLLEQQKDGTLTPNETVQLKALRREADILMFRKAYAAVLLKCRGYHPPSLHELPPPTRLIVSR
jgi:hypothetical protein